MATYDDYDGVFFTIQSLRMYHRICNTDAVEFIVIDTNPSGEHGKAVKKFMDESLGSLGKYIPQDNKIPSSFNKYDVVKHASGKYILILDCHVLLKHNAIDNLLNYYWQKPDCKDLVQGPLLYDDLKNVSTHFDPQWRGDMYGIWATNLESYKLGKPFEIPMNGMGLCSFEKKHWPGISSHFIGFGGEEGYISEKFRRNGGKNICVPTVGWNHRFGRPNGVKYRLILEDRIWNYFIGWMEITQDPDHQMIQDIYNHFKERVPVYSLDALLAKAKKITFKKGE